MALKFTPQSPPKPHIHVGSRTFQIPAHLPSPSVVGLLRISNNSDVTNAWGEVFEELKATKDPAVIARLRERGEEEPILYTVVLSPKWPEATIAFYI